MESTQQDVWVVKVNNGTGIFQRPDGLYYVQYPDGSEEPISEFEVRRLITELIERSRIEEVVDQMLASVEDLQEQPLDRTHRQKLRERVIVSTQTRARKAGLLRTGSVNLKRLEGNQK